MSAQDTRLIAHLMRRAGFGATREEIEAYAARGYDATVEELIDPPDAGWMGDYMARRFHHEQSGMMGPWGSGDNWLYRMITTRAPLTEKTALFWHSIFATGYPKVIHGKMLSDQIKMFRRYGLGNFRDASRRACQGPGDDRLARQLRQPRRRHQRELRPRAAGALLYGRWQLHGGGHQGVLPRLHRLDDRQHRVHGAALRAGLGLALRADIVALRLQRETITTRARRSSWAGRATSTARTSST